MGKVVGTVSDGAHSAVAETKAASGADDYDREARLRDEVLSAVEELRDEVIEMRANVRAGKVATQKEASRLLGELRHWLKIAMDMEKTVGDIIADASDSGGTVDDLAALRAEIGCRLNRLRECRPPV